MTKNHNSRIILLPIIMITFFLIGGICFAIDFETIDEVNNEVFVLSTYRTINISVNNTDSSANITGVYIILPSTMRFYNDSNSSTASANFTINGYNYTWLNTTSSGIIQNGTTAYFSLQVQLPNTGNPTLTISLSDTNNVWNSSQIILNTTGVSSSSRNFSTHNKHFSINWSTMILTLESNVDNNIIYINNSNSSTDTYPIFFQASTYTTLNSYLDSGKKEVCLPVSGNGMSLNLTNLTNSNSNTTVLLNRTNTSTFSLSIFSYCPPGRYYGSFYAKNSTNSSDNLTVYNTIEIPISVNNTVNPDTKNAYFRGSNTSGGNHSFYMFTNFSTSVDYNITGLTINITGMGSDIDIFVLDESNNLLAKSIQTNNTSEWIDFLRISDNELWRFVLGNVTSAYNGSIHFTTLNTTFMNNTNDLVEKLDYGLIEPNQTSVLNFTLKNEGDYTIPSVQENIEIYRVTNFTGSSANNFELLVPNFATKVKVSVIWNNDTVDWALILKDNNGANVSNSTDNLNGSNVTGVELEEFVIFDDYFNTTNQGLWNITIINLTNNRTSSYNITAKVWMNATEWLNSSYVSQNITTVGQVNSSVNITLNVTIPEINVLNGSYNGFVKYYNGSGSEYRIPIEFDLMAGSVLMNRSFVPPTITIKENIGFNRTLTFNITMDNHGGYPVYFNTTNANSQHLNLTNSSYINMSVSYPSSPIAVGGSSNITVTLYIDNEKTGDNQGIYNGWLAFNTTNSSINSSSYPYKTFNNSIRVNLTSELNVTIVGINPSLLPNATSGGDVRYNVTVRLLNGTSISNSGLFYDGAFLSSGLRETNYTSEVVTMTNDSLIGYDGSVCMKNYTVPAGAVGGRYNITLNVTWESDFAEGTGVNLTGIGVYNYLEINDTGLKINTTNSTSISIDDTGSDGIINVTVINYGPILANGRLNISSSNTDHLTVDPNTLQSGDCGSDSGSTYFNLALSQGEMCWFTFEIDPNNVSEDKNVAVYVNTTNSAFNNITFTVNIDDTGEDGSSSSSEGSSGSSGGNECTSNSQCGSAYYCSSNECKALDCESSEYIEDHECVGYELKINDFDETFSLTAGEKVETKVSVKETNGEDPSVMLNVSLGDIGTNITITPKTCSTPCTFNVTIETNSETEIGEHIGIFKAYMYTAQSVKKSETFKFSVHPTESKKIELNNTCDDYISQIASIKSKFESLKASGVIPEDNLTVLTDLIDKLGLLGDDVKSALDSGDYLTVNSLLKQIESTITDVNIRFTDIENTGVPIIDMRLVTWIIIAIVVIGVVGFLVYLLLPPKQDGPTTTTTKSFKPKSNSEGMFSKIKGKAKLPKKGDKPPNTYKITKYSKGYQKQKAFVYKKKEGRIKKMFKKKKQKKIKDFAK